MTSAVNNVNSAGLLSGYFDSTSNADLNAKAIFKKLSIDVGSDGKTITKGQLDSYIAGIESGKTVVTDEVKEGLLSISENWDSISKGRESISSANVSGFSDVLKSMDEPDKNSSTFDIRELNDSIQTQVKNYIVDSAFKFNAYGKNETVSGLSSMLNTLLTGMTDERDDENADMIAALVDLIEKNKNVTSTIEREA